MTPATPDLPAVEQSIVEMTNAYRAKHSLGAVRTDPSLEAAARAYAGYLARSGKFAHDADGRQPSDRATAAGYDYCQVAENLAMALDSRGFTTKALAEEAINGWINSPGHRKNLLAPHVTEIGVAVARVPDRHPKFVTVQMFGRPESLMYTFQVSNASKSRIGYTFDGESHQIEPGYGVRHSACNPAEIVFGLPDEARKQAGRAKLSGRYKAEDGQVFTISGEGKSLAVEVDRRETLEAPAAGRR